MSGYDYFRERLTIIQKFVSTSATLQRLFTQSYFAVIEKQINEMEKKGLVGPINSLFLWLVDDSQNGFTQAKLFVQYIDLIFSHPTTINADRNHIIGQVSGMGSTDTLFEVSILGNLLKQLPADKIKLFPRTVGKRDVEAKVLLEDRWVYIDATVINDSEAETKALTDHLNGKPYVGNKYIDFEKDNKRFIGKIEYKSQQFIPSQPSALILQMFGTRPLFIGDEWGKPGKSITIKNVGLILEFSRKSLVKTTTHNCDSSCSLTTLEIKMLEELLSNGAFQPLVYGVA